jgi:RNA polymerase sigma-70 factor (ECF subfamily)
VCYKDNVNTSARKDSSIIEEVLEGNPEAFAELVRSHQARVLSFCRSMVGGAAEDAAQEIFIKAFTALPGFRLDASFSTWLYRIAYNHCCTLLKKGSVSPVDSLDSMPDAAREKALLAASFPEPESGEEAAAAAMKAMAGLPDNYRAVMALRLEGENYRSIALALGLSEHSVRARLKRARLILRAGLRHFFYQEKSKLQEKR